MTNRPDLPDDELQREIDQWIEYTAVYNRPVLDQIARDALHADDAAWDDYNRDWRTVRPELRRYVRQQRLREAAHAREAVKRP